MKLTSFRIQNYKKIHDTGWIEVGDLTAFVGKNEAGKSAVFRGLSKFNPSDGEDYDGLKEFPRRRYTDEFKRKDWPVSSCRFALLESDLTELRNVSILFAGVTSVEITRHYSGDYTTSFIPDIQILVITELELRELLSELVNEISKLVAPDGKGELLKELKISLSNELNNRAKTIPDDITYAYLTQIAQFIKQHANEEWQQALLIPIAELITPLLERSKNIEDVDKAESKILDLIPQFLYFDKYDVLDSAVHFPSFLTDSSPKKRITKCLFQHVGLNVDTLSNLGAHNHSQPINVEEFRRKIDERAIHFSSASNAMTEKFSNWWEQRKHKFRYQADGDFFRIWVSDDLDPSEIELDQRSNGMQYFFSFYLVFLVEAEGAHKDSILLLDEPGLHLHGTAQAKLIQFFEKLSKTNQTMYSTHSPFLVDVNHFERVRAVYEDDAGTTKVTEDILLTDDDTIFPLQSALGYDITQSLFIGPNCLLVEGPSDMIYLRCISSILERQKRIGLSSKWTITPVGGSDKIWTFVALMGSQKGMNIAILVDIQPKDKQTIENLYKKRLLKKSKVKTFGDYLLRDSADIEDMFDVGFYLNLVNGEYKTSIKETDLKSKHPRILVRIEDYFKQTGQDSIGFNHYRPARFMQESVLDSGTLDEKTLSLFEQMFKDINSMI